MVWLLIRLPRVQEPLFRCEFASVHRHCGGASNFLFFTSSAFLVVCQ